MNRYTLMPVPGATSDAAWTVRANNDGSQIGRLALTAASVTIAQLDRLAAILPHRRRS